MARFRVIRAHDGLKEGEVRTLAPSANTRYMVENGWWEELPEGEGEKPQKPRRTAATRTTKKTTNR